jgi:hypothetical protein
LKDKLKSNTAYDVLVQPPRHQNIVTIYTSDWHLSDRICDEYRWGIFPFLEKLIADKGARYLMFMGDLCEDKDQHRARLINRIMRELRVLARALAKNGGDFSIMMLCGNHDVKDQPFFKFLHRWFRGKVLYFTKPAEIGLFQQKFLFIPFTKQWAETIARFDLSQYDRVLIHQPIAGAETENGSQIGAQDGIRLGSLRKAKLVVAGDQHVAQTIGNVVYCGAPHPIKFGDNYQPRVLVETDGEFESVNVPTIKKAKLRVSSFDDFKAAKLAGGDMAKVEVVLPRSQFSDWRGISDSIQKYSDRFGINLVSVKLVEKMVRPRLNKVDEKPATTTPLSVLKTYAKVKEIDQMLFPFARELLTEKK